MNINEVAPHAGEYINRRNNCFHVCLFQSWVSSLDIKYWVISNADSPHVLGIQRGVLTGSFIRLVTSGYYYQHCWLCYFCLVRNLFTLYYIIIKTQCKRNFKYHCMKVLSISPCKKLKNFGFFSDLWISQPSFSTYTGKSQTLLGFSWCKINYIPLFSI